MNDMNNLYSRLHFKSFLQFIVLAVFFQVKGMEKHTLKNVNNSMNTNIYSYLETSGGQSFNPYLNVVHFFNTRAD